MAHKYRTEKRTVNVEICTAICDKCGEKIAEAESYEDGYNPAHYVGEFQVKIETHYKKINTWFDKRCVLCRLCAEDILNDPAEIMENWWKSLEVEEKES